MSIKAAMRGLVAVELTDRERVLFGWWVFEVGAALVLVKARAVADDDIAGMMRFNRYFTTARARADALLWRSLQHGAHGHGKRTTTIKMYRDAAQFWCGACMKVTEDSFDDLPARLRIQIFELVPKLAAAAGAARGKRPRVPDREVHSLVEYFSMNRRKGDPIARAAACLGLHPESVRRALKRWRGRSRLSALLLSE